MAWQLTDLPSWHPLSCRFANRSSEITLNHDVVPPLNDNVQLSAAQYRMRLYEASTHSLLSISLFHDANIQKLSHKTTRLPAEQIWTEIVLVYTALLIPSFISTCSSICTKAIIQWKMGRVYPRVKLLKKYYIHFDVPGNGIFRFMENLGLCLISTLWYIYYSPSNLGSIAKRSYT